MEDSSRIDLIRAFDSMAEEYDLKYVRNPSMQLMRRRVWAQLEERVKPGDRVLELGCGTGEDALFLARSGCRVLATDCSPHMLRLARDKAAAAGLENSIQFKLLEIDDLGREFSGTENLFDCVLSNFGGLNTVPHLRDLERPLLNTLRPNGYFVACVMGRHCIWDWLIELIHLRFDSISARRKNGVTISVDGHNVTCYFPTPVEFFEAFSSLKRTYSQALALFVPPPRITSEREVYDWLWKTLDRIEQPFARSDLLSGYGDHFLAVLQKE
jgi:ubiquinone/menaquinone biosynthesis C-methylase UbiE